MGRNYSEQANKRTDPYFLLKTWLLGMFSLFTGLNCILSGLYFYHIGSGEQAVYDIFIGVTFLLAMPLVVLDTRKEMRRAVAVAGQGIIYLVFASLLIIELPAHVSLPTLGIEVGIIVIASVLVRQKS